SQALSNSATVRLLNSPHAPLIASFLHDQFKQQHQLTIPHHLLVERLEDYLVLLNESYDGRYSRTAVQYLDDWCNKHGYLRKYHLADRDEPVYELTTETERALRWLEELQTRQFIGTESRFLLIFDLMQDMVERSNENVEERLRYLAEEKVRIDAEIERITATGEVETYSDTQVREKFMQLNDTARDLLADFREVEDNFRGIAREVQQQQLQANIRKGEIVGRVLDADEALRESDQGRSFYAFWQFLMSQNKQDELRDLLHAALEIPAVADMQEDRLLRHLKRSLIDAGSKIIESNRRLAEQLRKLLDEQNLQEARRVRELAAEIKQMAAQLATAETLPREPFVTITGLPEIEMSLERPLWTPRPRVNFEQVLVEPAVADISTEQLETLYTQFFVDENLLREQIDALLEEQPQATLSDVLARYPLRKGLAELLGYFAIASRTQPQGIDAQTVVAVSLAADRFIRVPQITFDKE
ncbi:MAG: DUF3375 domain-containing protein, partial [Anaerolineales bacterium]|nr:DUF3375 domain-containing protein [Anaerolineales bacterium]